MLLSVLRWLGRYLSMFVLAFILALVVWVSAVITADPNINRELSRGVNIEFLGKDPSLKIMGEYPTTLKLTLMGPRSVWERLEAEPDLMQAWVDLSTLGPGEYDLPVQVQINLDLVRLISQNPEKIHLVMEPIVVRSFPVTLVVNGELPLGYKVETPEISPQQVNISGPLSIVSRVNEIRAQIDISGASQSITRTVTLAILDETDKSLTGLSISPTIVTVYQPISLLGGYRNVIVKVVTTGIVASGYRLTNYFVSPSSVVVFSSDPSLVNALPGYVETKPLDLTNADDDFEQLLELNLPAGISVIGDTRVLVQVSIAAIESNLTISLPVEITGLRPGLEVSLVPSTVDVILSGPVPVLKDLKPTDIRVKVDLTGFDVGLHQVIPVVDFLPNGVQKQAIIPATVGVTISLAPTPTPTITPTPQPTLEITPTPSATVNRQP